MSLSREKFWNKPFASRVLVESIEDGNIGAVCRYFCDTCLYHQIFEPKEPCPECGSLKWSLRRKIHVKVTEIYPRARESDSEQRSLTE